MAVFWQHLGDQLSQPPLRAMTARWRTSSVPTRCPGSRRSRQGDLDLAGLDDDVASAADDALAPVLLD